MNIRLKLPKEKVKELLNNEGDVIAFNLIAFPNNTTKENSNRPSFRVYEELNKDAE